MLGFLFRSRDERLLDSVIDGYERYLPASQYASQGRGTLRMVVSELRRPTSPGVQAMNVGQILAMIALILRLITEFFGEIGKVAAEVRRTIPLSA